jgi:cold shock CspA family protein/arsenate reductase-like glutaredoxin family protein
LATAARVRGFRSFRFKVFMTIGTVKFFNLAKKFGFITPDGGGKDLYFPSNAIAPDGMAALKPGRRVSFERETDPRGDKAVKLTLLEETPAPPPAPRQDVTIYADATQSASQEIEAAVRATGRDPVLVDYAVTPLTVEQLKRLSLAVSATGQSLVYRYHPMFLDLQLDDRFIGESEYWTAVAEHPVLIQGPIVMAGNRAGICASPEDVAAFFGQAPAVETEQKPKQISARLAALINGQALPARPAEAKPEPKPSAAAPRPAVAKPAPVAVKPIPAAAPKTATLKLAPRKAVPAVKKPVKAPVKASVKKAVKAPAKPAAKTPPAAKAKKR